ncbi:uncharacterized protein LOC143362040 isoform X2 [Halictus rubicundus]
MATKQNNDSRNSEEKLETNIIFGKRKCSIAQTDNSISKKLCNNSDLTMTLSNLSHNSSVTSEYGSNVSHTLIKFMHQLDLSILCLLRKYVYKEKYPLMSLSYGNYDIDKFNNIFLCCNNKSVYVQVESVDRYYTNNALSYSRLFGKDKRSVSLNDYFDSYVKHVISKSCNLSNDIKYLVIYTNSGLDLTKDKKLKKGRFKNFYDFKLDSIDMKECDILKDFLFTNDNAQGRDFYQFSRDKTSMEELLNRLEFSPVIYKAMQERKLSQEFEKEIKKTFFEKLVFAVNQPDRKELNSIVKRELEKNSKILDNYTDLQNRVLQDLMVPSMHKKLDFPVSVITYEANVLMFFLHAMYLHKSMLSINFEEKSDDTSNDITVDYRGRITYVKTHATNSRIGYSLLFPIKRLEKKSAFSINRHFSLFIKESTKNIRYFIIYTNTDLDLTNDKELKKGQSKDFYPLKFNTIDIQKKRYKILRDCSCINKNGLYQFSKDEKTQEKLLDLLQLPPSLQKEKDEGRFSDESEKEVKKKFLKTLIFAVDQTSEKSLNSIIRDEIERNDNVPYNYEELCELMLRWIESHEFDCITREIMERLLDDIRNNRSSFQKMEDKDT